MFGSKSVLRTEHGRTSNQLQLLLSQFYSSSKEAHFAPKQNLKLN